MKLYFAPDSCAVAVWIALEWAGAEYEVERVELGSEEYRKINPSGAVPALDTGDGKIKTQAGPLLFYIAERYPEANLGPDEGIEERFYFEEISAFLTSDYHPAFWPLFVPEEFTVSKDEGELEHIKQAAYKSLDAMASTLDEMLEGKKHVYKNKKTVLDAYAFILSRWLDDTPKSWEVYPNLKAFMEHMEKDESVQKILHAPENQE